MARDYVLPYSWFQGSLFQAQRVVHNDEWLRSQSLSEPGLGDIGVGPDLCISLGMVRVLTGPVNAKMFDSSPRQYVLASS
jgi:hypothetical protein